MGRPRQHNDSGVRVRHPHSGDTGECCAPPPVQLPQESDGGGHVARRERHPAVPPYSLAQPEGELPVIGADFPGGGELREGG